MCGGFAPDPFIRNLQPQALGAEYPEVLRVDKRLARQGGARVLAVDQPAS